MADFWKNVSENWQDDLIGILGVGLFLSPWVLGYTGHAGAFGNALVIGAVMVVLALAALVNFHAWEEWAGMALGVWMTVSPWAIGFAGLATAMWTAVIFGVLMLVLAGWSLYRHGGTSTA